MGLAVRQSWQFTGRTKPKIIVLWVANRPAAITVTEID
jgi:hypothetical protein